jgi:hypothetical protein
VLVFHIGAFADFDDGVAHVGLLLVRGSFIFCCLLFFTPFNISNADFQVIKIIYTYAFNKI